MHTEVMKWVSIAALLLTVVFWRSAGSYQSELNVVIALASGVILIQAFRATRYVWAAGFLAMGIFFNPVVPVFRLAGDFGLAAVVLAIPPFAMSLIALRPRPLLSIPSITDRTPGSQSL